MTNHTPRLGKLQAEPPRRSPFGDLLNVEQTSQYLGCSANTVRNMIHRGELSAVRLGPRMVRIRRDDLDAILRPYEGGQAGTWAHLR